MKKAPYTLLLLLYVMAFQSCIKNYDGNTVERPAEFKSGVAAPLGFKTFSLENYLMDSVEGMELVKDKDGFLTLLYSGIIETVKAKDYINIPNISSSPLSVTNNTPIPIALGLGNIDPIIDSSYIALTLSNASDADLARIIIESMTLSFQFQNTINSGTINIHIPGLSKNGNGYNQTYNLSENSATSQLENYTLTFDKNQGSNRFLVITTIQLQGGSGTIDPGENIVTFQSSIENVQYEAIFGYLGHIEMPVVGDSILISFARNFELETEAYGFKNPQLSFLFENSFGVPLGISFSSFFYTSGENSKISITSPEVPAHGEFKILNFPGSYTNPPGIVNDQISLTPSNSDIKEVVSNFPSSFAYTIQSTLNPDGDPNIQNFIHRESSLQISAALTIPMEGYAHNLVVRDTLDFNIKDLIFTKYDNIKSIEFQFSYINRFPLAFGFNLIFLDAFGQQLSTLSDDSMIFTSGSDNDNDGKTDEPGTEPIVKIIIDRETAYAIENAEQLIVRGNFSTNGSENKDPVKFYVDYWLYVNLGFIVEVETEI